MTEEQTSINPLEDQRASALKHYEEASSAIHHWSSFIHHAIKTYNPKSEPVKDVPVEDGLDESDLKDYILAALKNNMTDLHDEQGNVIRGIGEDDLEYAANEAANEWLDKNLKDVPEGVDDEAFSNAMKKMDPKL